MWLQFQSFTGWSRNEAAVCGVSVLNSALQFVQPKWCKDCGGSRHQLTPMWMITLTRISFCPLYSTSISIFPFYHPTAQRSTAFFYLSVCLHYTCFCFYSPDFLSPFLPPPIILVLSTPTCLNPRFLLPFPSSPHPQHLSSLLPLSSSTLPLSSIFFLFILLPCFLHQSLPSFLTPYSPSRTSAPRLSPSRSW